MTGVFSVHSEVGELRIVMVCPPGRAHDRLTPGNCRNLLFDDILWVKEARKDLSDSVLKMRDRGVEVLDMSVFLAESMDDTEAHEASCSGAA
jgi:arginine deiminase